jgi:osmotically inducible protein OsmC
MVDGQDQEDYRMPVRTGEAVWEGGLRRGRGTARFGDGVFEGRYSFSSRFFDEGKKGTNPEELIATAHASCFSMALAGEIEAGGYDVKSVHTIARVHVEAVETGHRITRIELDTEADVPGLDEAAFLEYAMQAKVGCPVSQALAAVNDIRLQARLARAERV